MCFFNLISISFYKAMKANWTSGQPRSDLLTIMPICFYLIWWAETRLSYYTVSFCEILLLSCGLLSVYIIDYIYFRWSCLRTSRFSAAIIIRLTSIRINVYFHIPMYLSFSFSFFCDLANFLYTFAKR